jgi:3-hydroxy-9,10-secoandrosta-1,3,5(10)-triene-9,17-dione monooxygenase reductase component
VTVVTVIDDGLAHGITVNSFTSVSLRPPLVLVCLNGSGATCRLVRRHGRFAVNVLARDQRALAAYFADPDRPAGRRQFETLAWRPAPSGMPLLDDAVAWFDCVVEQMVTAGDHDVVVGRVLDVSWHAEEPLVFCGGEYTGATPGPMRKVAHRHTWEPRSSQ